MIILWDSRLWVCECGHPPSCSRRSARKFLNFKAKRLYHITHDVVPRRAAAASCGCVCGAVPGLRLGRGAPGGRRTSGGTRTSVAVAAGTAHRGCPQRAVHCIGEAALEACGMCSRRAPQTATWRCCSGQAALEAGGGRVRQAPQVAAPRCRAGEAALEAGGGCAYAAPLPVAICQRPGQRPPAGGAQARPAGALVAGAAALGVLSASSLAAAVEGTSEHSAVASTCSPQERSHLQAFGYVSALPG